MSVIENIYLEDSVSLGSVAAVWIDKFHKLELEAKTSIWINVCKLFVNLVRLSDNSDIYSQVCENKCAIRLVKIVYFKGSNCR